MPVRFEFEVAAGAPSAAAAADDDVDDDTEVTSDDELVVVETRSDRARRLATGEEPLCLSFRNASKAHRTHASHRSASRARESDLDCTQ